MVNPASLAIEAQIEQPNKSDSQPSDVAQIEPQQQRRQQQQQAIEESPVTHDQDEPRSTNLRLTKRRWAILFAISLFSLILAMTDEPTVILVDILELLDLQIHQYLYITQFNFYIPILLTMPTAWFVDRFGIRMPMYGAVVFLFIRNFSRALMFNPDLAHWKQFKRVYWIVANLASMQVASLFYCTPMKIAEYWFPASERSIAWATMMSISSAGSSIMSFTLPRIIHSLRDLKILFYLNMITPFIASAAVLICITKSRPKYPPSERMLRASNTKIPFLASIKNIFKSRNIMLHLFHEAIFEGVYVAILVVVQDLLTTSGHTKFFVGDILAFNSVISIVLAISLSSLVHRFQNITLTCKLASLSKAILLVVYIFSMLYPFQDWVVYLTSFIFHIFRCWASPNGYNMTAHLAAGKVSEATIAGFATTITPLFVVLGELAIASLLGNSHGKSDYSRPAMFVAIVALFNTTVYLIFFNGRTKNRGEEATEYDAQSVGSNSTRVLDLD